MVERPTWALAHQRTLDFAVYSYCDPSTVLPRLIRTFKGQYLGAIFLPLVPTNGPQASGFHQLRASALLVPIDEGLFLVSQQVLYPMLFALNQVYYAKQETQEPHY